MDTEHLSSFLKKYEKLPVPRRHLIAALNEFLGGKSKITDVSLSRGILHVKTNGAARQELYLKKEKVIAFLKEKNLAIAFTDIR